MVFPIGESLRKLPGPVLVTGHTGFKGTWLTILLESIGIDVVGLSLAPEPNSMYQKLERANKIPEMLCDIRDYNAVATTLREFKPSTIFHMAAEPLVLKSYTNPKLTMETNVQGTWNVVNAAFEFNDTKSIVVITSDKVYKNNNSGRKFIETDELFGNDPYSMSKVGAELVVSTWQKIFLLNGGPKLISARAGNVIGGGDTAQNRLLPELIESFIGKKPIVIKNPESTRPWQHVLDPLFGYIMASEYLLQSNNLENFNFGPNEDSLSVDEVTKLAKQYWGSDSKVIYNKPEVTLESINLALNSDKSNKILNWNPIWTQQEALELTINWWKKVSSNLESPLDCTINDINSSIEKLSLKR
jgi:CDP-glucose 4,6-dehydratase